MILFEFVSDVVQFLSERRAIEPLAPASALVARDALVPEDAITVEVPVHAGGSTELPLASVMTDTPALGATIREGAFAGHGSIIIALVAGRLLVANWAS